MSETVEKDRPEKSDYLTRTVCIYRSIDGRVDTLIGERRGWCRDLDVPEVAELNGQRFALVNTIVYEDGSPRVHNYEEITNE